MMHQSSGRRLTLACASSVLLQVGDKSLERFRQEYEKLHRALKKARRLPSSQRMRASTATI